MKYCVIVSSSFPTNTAKEELTRKVQKAIDEGWRPLGGVSLTYNNGHKTLILAQALIKDDT